MRPPLLAFLLSVAHVAAEAVECRDRLVWPFSSKSVWNMPLGSGAKFVPANIYREPYSPPRNFYVDQDWFISTTENDPGTALVDQGWWGEPTGDAHCDIKGPNAGFLPFPQNLTARYFGGNNAAAILLPDNVTLVQAQPLYRCSPDSPVLALWSQRSNCSILDDGTWGSHGGSALSAIGGTIRLGELLPGAPPIRHALKLMLYAADYYWPGNETVPCWRWPALQCDGIWNASRDPSNPNFYNGTEPKLKPGALLAVPPNVSAAIVGQFQTDIGRKLLAAFTQYGGYLDDNTASNTGAFNVEAGVVEQVLKAYPTIDLSGIGPRNPLFADLVAIYSNFHIVDNNAPDSVGGGGEPVQPLAPPICGAE